MQPAAGEDQETESEEGVIYVYNLKFSELPATVQAGTPFSGRVTCYDEFQNICSTGTNVYEGTIGFTAEYSGNSKQNPTLPGTTTYDSADEGTLYFSNEFVLRYAGTRWLKAYDIGTPSINTEYEPYSSQPTIDVTFGPADKFFVTPNTDSDVSAGSTGDPGKQPISAQLVDSYENSVSSGGVKTYLSIERVSGFS